MQSEDAGNVQLHPQLCKLLKPNEPNPRARGSVGILQREAKGSGGVQGIGFAKVTSYTTQEDLKH